MAYCTGEDEAMVRAVQDGEKGPVFEDGTMQLKRPSNLTRLVNLQVKMRLFFEGKEEEAYTLYDLGEYLLDKFDQRFDHRANAGGYIGTDSLAELAGVEKRRVYELLHQDITDFDKAKKGEGNSLLFDYENARRFCVMMRLINDFGVHKKSINDAVREGDMKIIFDSMTRN